MTKKKQGTSEIPNGDNTSNKPNLSTTPPSNLKFTIKLKSKEITANGVDSSPKPAKLSPEPANDDVGVTIKELMQNGVKKRASGGAEEVKEKKKRRKKKENVELEDVRENKEKKKKSKRKEVEEEEEEKEGEEEEEEEEKCESGQIPINRISTIVRSEDSDIKISQEAIFLINRATEKFLQLLSKEAYACASANRKKSIAYNHLSSVVSKEERFNFLSDFVPEKVKAEDALALMAEAEK